MDIINIVTGIFLILLGLIIKHGKMYFLIAGYNTMPEEKKKNYDISGFATLMRNYFILMGIIIIAGHYILAYFELFEMNRYLILITITVIIPILLIKGRNYNNSPGQPDQ